MGKKDTHSSFQRRTKDANNNPTAYPECEFSKEEFNKKCRRVAIKKLPCGMSSSHISDNLLLNYNIETKNFDKANSSCKLIMKSSEEKDRLIRDLNNKSYKYLNQKYGLNFPNENNSSQDRLEVQELQPDFLVCVTKLNDMQPPISTNDDFRKQMSSYGQIEKCLVVCSPDTGKSFGYGLVQFTNKDSSIELKNDLNQESANFIVTEVCKTYDDLLPRVLFASGSQIEHVIKSSGDDPEGVYQKLKHFFSTPRNPNANFNLHKQLGKPKYCDYDKANKQYCVLEYDNWQQAEQVHNALLEEYSRHQLQVSYCRPQAAGKVIFSQKEKVKDRLKLSEESLVMGGRSVGRKLHKGLLPEPSNCEENGQNSSPTKNSGYHNAPQNSYMQSSQAGHQQQSIPQNMTCSHQQSHQHANSLLRPRSYSETSANLMSRQQIKNQISRPHQHQVYQNQQAHSQIQGYQSNSPFHHEIQSTPTHLSRDSTPLTNSAQSIYDSPGYNNLCGSGQRLNGHNRQNTQNSQNSQNLQHSQNQIISSQNNNSITKSQLQSNQYSSQSQETMFKNMQSNCQHNQNSQFNQQNNNQMSQTNPNNYNAQISQNQSQSQFNLRNQHNTTNQPNIHDSQQRDNFRHHSGDFAYDSPRETHSPSFEFLEFQDQYNTSKRSGDGFVLERESPHDLLRLEGKFMPRSEVYPNELNEINRGDFNQVYDRNGRSSSQANLRNFIEPEFNRHQNHENFRGGNDHYRNDFKFEDQESSFHFSEYDSRDSHHHQVYVRERLQTAPSRNLHIEQYKTHRRNAAASAVAMKSSLDSQKDHTSPRGFPSFTNPNQTNQQKHANQQCRANQQTHTTQQNHPNNQNQQNQQNLSIMKHQSPPAYFKNNKNAQIQKNQHNRQPSRISPLANPSFISNEQQTHQTAAHANYEINLNIEHNSPLLSNSPPPPPPPPQNHMDNNETNQLNHINRGLNNFKITTVNPSGHPISTLSLDESDQTFSFSGSEKINQYEASTNLVPHQAREDFIFDDSPRPNLDDPPQPMETYYNGQHYNMFDSKPNEMNNPQVQQYPSRRSSDANTVYRDNISMFNSIPKNSLIPRRSSNLLPSPTNAAQLKITSPSSKTNHINWQNSLNETTNHQGNSVSLIHSNDYRSTSSSVFDHHTGN